MPHTDLPLDQLITYRPDVAEPADFDEFWRRTVAETSAYKLDVTSDVVDTVYRTVVVHDVEFAGFGGDRIRA